MHGRQQGTGAHRKGEVRKSDAADNQIERFNGTGRERVKVQRRWKFMQTAIPEGNRVFCNFVGWHGPRRTDTRIIGGN
jgi:hypothetical protein